MILQGQMSLFHSEQGNNPTPIVVHCSAGVGRTGCVIALDQICRQLNDIKNLVGDLSNGSLGTPSLSIFAMVRRLREIRWNMIQNAEQYAFQYSFVGEYQRAQYLNNIPNEISVESNNTDSRISPFSELRDSEININNSIDIGQKSNSKKKFTQSHTKKPVLSNNSTMNVGFQEDKKKLKPSMESPLKINTQMSNDSTGQEKFYDLIETPVLGRMQSENFDISKDMFISSNSKDFTNGTTNRERSKTEQTFMSNKKSENLFAGDMCQEDFANKNYDKKMSYNLDQIEDKSMGSDDRKPPVKRLKSKKKNKLDYNNINWDDDDSKNIEAAPKFQQEEELESPTYIRKKKKRNILDADIFNENNDINGEQDNNLLSGNILPEDSPLSPTKSPIKNSKNSTENQIQNYDQNEGLEHLTEAGFKKSQTTSIQVNIELNKNTTHFGINGNSADKTSAQKIDLFSKNNSNSNPNSQNAKRESC